MFCLFYILKRKKMEKHFCTKFSRKNKNECQKIKIRLFFDARVTMKERSTKRCLKRACIFHFILVGLPTRLILFVKVLMTNDLNFLIAFFCQYFPLCSPLLPINRQTFISNLAQGFRQWRM